MQIRRVTVGYSRLVTEGNFSNRRYTCELTAELRDGDHWETQRDNLERQCVEYVESKIAGGPMKVVTEKQAAQVSALIRTAKEFTHIENGLPF